MNIEAKTPHQTVNVVAGCLICDDDKYLLVQERKASVHGQWNLPAGRVHEGESLEQAAAREALEETGYVVEVGRQVIVAHYAANEPVLHAYEAKIVGGDLQPSPDDVLDAKWLTLNEIVELHKQGKLRVDWPYVVLQADGKLEDRS
ncbi:MAG: NUDIX domain-containing protein [Candidatus Woesebacteria bacterium]|jgi:ADP-ribose pyrophosphatase YjhB (NUDIX family)